MIKGIFVFSDIQEEPFFKQILAEAQDEKLSVEEKSEKLFTLQGYNLNPLYLESKKIFTEFESYRNDVAHGKGKKEYTKAVAFNMLKASLYQIMALDLKIDSFESLL